MLNLGVVRDATLVGTNDFIIFSETLENVGKRGVESLHLTMDLCSDGSTSAPVEIHPCLKGRRSVRVSSTSRCALSDACLWFVASGAMLSCAIGG